MTRAPRLAALLVVALGLFAAPRAHGADAGSSGLRPGAGDEVETLEKSLADEHAALSTSDCTDACRALGSIRRAAERICALADGPRCSAARARAEDAARRVRAACGECALEKPAPRPAPEQDARQAERATVETASAPPAESSRGGCASCQAAGTGAGDLAGGALALLGVAAALRRGRSRRRSP